MNISIDLEPDDFRIVHNMKKAEAEAFFKDKQDEIREELQNRKYKIIQLLSDIVDEWFEEEERRSADRETDIKIDDYLAKRSA